MGCVLRERDGSASRAVSTALSLPRSSNPSCCFSLWPRCEFILVAAPGLISFPQCDLRAGTAWTIPGFRCPSVGKELCWDDPCDKLLPCLTWLLPACSHLLFRMLISCSIFTRGQPQTIPAVFSPWDSGFSILTLIFLQFIPRISSEEVGFSEFSHTFRMFQIQFWELPSHVQGENSKKPL